MRVSLTIGALILIACVVPATGRAATPPDTGAAAEAAVGVGSGMAAPGCRCPGVRHRHVWRKHRHVRHVRRWIRTPAILVTNIPPPVYDPPIPAPWDTAYDRAMTLHFRSPEVSGTWTDEPGFAHTPPVHGVQRYRVQAGAAVLQYDGLIGEYVPLAQADARRAFPPVAAAAAAIPAPAAR